MGVLAIKAENIDGQVGNAALTRAAFNMTACVDFATELDRKLQGKTDPTPKSGASESKPAPGEASPCKDGNQGQPVASPSAESLVAIVTAAPITASGNSAAGNKPTPNPERAARVSSDNATSVSLEIASTFAKGSTHLADEAGAGTANPRAGATGEKRVPAQAALQNEAPGKPNPDAGILSGEAAQVPASSPKTMAAQDEDSKAASAKEAASAEDNSTLQASGPAQAVATGQEGSAPVTGLAPAPVRIEALHATSLSGLGKELQSAGVEALAPLQNLTTQLKQQDPSSGPEARARETAESGPESPSSAHATTGPNAQNSTPGQQARDLSLSIASELTKAASTSPKTKASQGKESKASSANRAASAEDNSTLQASGPAQAVATGQEGSAPVKGPTPTPVLIEAPHATSLSGLGKELQSAGVEALAPLQNVTTQSKQQDPSSGPEASARQSAESGSESQLSARDAIGPNAQISTQGPQSQDFSQPVPFELTKAVSTSSKTVSSQYEDSKPVLAETSSTLQSSRAGQSVITGQGASAPMTGAAPTSEGMEALHATSLSSLGNESQGAGPETLAPLLNVTAQLKQQYPSSGPETRTRQAVQSGPESKSSAHDAIGPNPQISTQGQQAPDFSLSIPFELTKAVSNWGVDEPQNSDRIKNSQQGKHAESGANSDADPGGATASLVLQPAETDGIETGSLVYDTKQANTSAEKQGGEAAQDSTKAANEKGGLPKADADLPLAQQLVPQGRAEARGSSMETAGASRSRGQAGSASVAEGYQANAEGVVSSARFIQQAGNAEMQVRLRSEALGPIAVHTIVKGSDIGASIRVEARDTQVMLANELSQLERALNERSLRVEHLDVLQGSVSGGRSDGNGPGNSHGSPSEPRQSFSSYSSGQTYTSLPEAPIVSEDWGLGLSSTRINLRV